ncbi:hypothetical protein FKW77_005037 [Venturia effusa]|uniref:Uncharacterized protein n=1 Tax=Venturia effusa TaxID=50376 RepID=A0A517LH57_9PEZI|nr:hypothetical protein FKW77_005037 [Venturia effusa]
MIRTSIKRDPANKDIISVKDESSMPYLAYKVFYLRDQRQVAIADGASDLKEIGPIKPKRHRRISLSALSLRRQQFGHREGGKGVLSASRIRARVLFNDKQKHEARQKKLSM